MGLTFTDEGTRAALELRERDPELRVLVLSQIVEPQHAVTLLSEHTDGFGYLLDRVVDIDQFVDAVRRVADGGSVVDPQVVAELLGRRRASDPLAEPVRGNERCSR